MRLFQKHKLFRIGSSHYREKGVLKIALFKILQVKLAVKILEK